MKVSVFCVSLLALFAGCVSNVLPEESDEEEVGVFKDPKLGGNEEPIESVVGECNAHTTHTTVIDGVTFTFELPVPCNIDLGVDKGDPPPERDSVHDKVNPSEVVNEYIDT